MSHLNKSQSGSKSSLVAKPILCYVSDRGSLIRKPDTDSTSALLKKVSAVAAAGITWIQLREKDLSGAACAVLTRQALQVASDLSKAANAPVRIIVNDRVDVALAERAHGVHLGESSIPVGEAKRLLQISPEAQNPQQRFLFGVSCHSIEAAQAAARDGADYVFFGPIFATPSKAMFGSPQGLTCLADVCASVSIPILAIGGITLQNARSCIEAGAAGVAAIRLFQDADNPALLINALRASFA